MNQQEKLVLLQLLADFLNQRPSSLPDNTDTEMLSLLTRQQQCEAICYAQTKLPVFQAAFAQTTYHAVNRRSFLNKLHDAFAAQGVAYLIFKGPEAARYYPHPELRSMGDLDILVHEKDKQTAHEILLGLGFTVDSTEATDHEWCYHAAGQEIELHHRLLYDSALNHAALTAFTDTAWENAVTEDGIAYRLKPEFHFVFLLLHIRKHILWAGIGIRQFLGLAEMMRYADLKWDTLSEMLDKLELRQFAGVCFDLIERWFGITTPISHDRTSEAFYENATETILGGGVFGMDGQSRAELADKAIMNNIRKASGSPLIKLRHILCTLFPKAKDMQENYPKLSSVLLCGRIPVLLPVIWLCRVYRAVFVRNTAKSGFRYAMRSVTIGKDMEQREEALRQWGI